MVVSGALDSRERITEAELAARLGISRTPVREALQRLEGDGLVLAQGRGVRVRVLSIDELVAVCSRLEPDWRDGRYSTPPSESLSAPSPRHGSPSLSNWRTPPIRTHVPATSSPQRRPTGRSTRT